MLVPEFLVLLLTEILSWIGISETQNIQSLIDFSRNREPRPGALSDRVAIFHFGTHGKIF